MDEEIRITIEEQEMAELGRLYATLEQKDPGSEEYNSILNEITKIRANLNEGNKIWVQKDENDSKMALEEKKLKQEKVISVLKGIGHGISLGLYAGMAWVTMKYNIKFGPISTRDAWTQIFRKK